MSTSDYATWSIEDVSTWLSHINLSSLIPVFERLGINGSQLVQIDEQFIKERLRMSKPSEVTALWGAISSLKESSPPSQPPHIPAGGTRRVSAQVHTGGVSALHGRPQSISASSASRIRTNSYDKAKGLPVPGIPGPSKTLPTRTLSTPPGGFRQPMLASGTAQALLEDCRHCGWIIKQGGGYKSCKFILSV